LKRDRKNSRVRKTTRLKKSSKLDGKILPSTRGSKTGRRVKSKKGWERTHLPKLSVNEYSISTLEGHIGPHFHCSWGIRVKRPRKKGGASKALGKLSLPITKTEICGTLGGGSVRNKNNTTTKNSGTKRGGRRRGKTEGLHPKRIAWGCG